MDNPILFDFPHELYTKRLFIRLPLPGDGKAVFAAIQASKAQLQKWLPFANKEQTLEKTEATIRSAHAAFLKREDLRLHIFHRKTKEFIGCTGLHRINWDIPKFEIGYWIDSRKSGSGLMTEAVEAVTNFAFSELKANRVEIRCDTENSRSRAIPERLGYTLEGIMRSDSLAFEGEGLRDTCLFAKIREP